MTSSPWFPDPQQASLRGPAVLRWGILAPGYIAAKFTSTVLANTDQTVTAVASRSPERAQRFATSHGIASVARSYRELLERTDVDIVYIAAPQSQHHALGMLAIAAGKHVLIEKPLALSAQQATELASAARTAGVFAAEAMWTRYLPQFDVISQLLTRGDLGTVKLASADVGWRVDGQDYPRLFDKEQGGGSLLDMGVYGIWFARFAVGRFLDSRSLVTAAATGVDTQSVIALRGADGRLATVSTSMNATATGLASITGTEGSLWFTTPFVFPGSFTVRDRSGDLHEWADRSGITVHEGLAYQAAAVARFVRDGRTESPLHSLDDSIAVLAVIDEVRGSLPGA